MNKAIQKKIEDVMTFFKDQIIKGQFKVDKTDSSWIELTTESGHEFRSYMSASPIGNVSIHGFMKIEFEEDQTEYVRELFKSRWIEDRSKGIDKMINELKQEQKELKS